ncbi:MAG: outer membrane beta-barrel protein [Putridiphycobacter sp.]|nr:outer membrane beta-barrel protein [Putridiphycobacter sp.]
MKINFKILLVMILAIVGTANHTTAQSVKKGNIIIDPYFGYPNFGRVLTTVISDAINFETGSEITERLIGPAGLRAEYMIADNFGLGFDFIYNSASLTGQVDSLNNDGTVNSTYDITGFARRFRFHVRANYHFVQDENFDAYVGFGAGTNNRTYGYITDFPNYDNESVGLALFPASARIALGARYYFAQNIGLNIELGLGGPLVSAGVSLKF